MNNIYLAITYRCNENCCFCPCSQHDKEQGNHIPLEKLKYTVDKTIANQKNPEVTISGGEPTLYPDLISLLEYLQFQNVKVTILSNGERFSNNNFINSLKSKVDLSQISFITTLHSHIADEHESANQTKGSFCRTIQGLKELSSLGANITVKHCVTKKNYRDLKQFYDFCNEVFDEAVDIQLCSIDYCGMSFEDAKKNALTFPELRVYLEKMFDNHLNNVQKGSNRKLYCINMPLCSCDVYYWNLIVWRKDKNYDAYIDPLKSGFVELEQGNTGPFGSECNLCKVQKICPGTYRTAFHILNNELIKPYK